MAVNIYEYNNGGQKIVNDVIYEWNGTQWIAIGKTTNSFNQIQIDGTDKFNSYLQRNINFQGINLNIYSGGVNTLIFSAQPQTNSSSTFSGGTVSGATNFTGGLTATTISATTYQNLTLPVIYKSTADGIGITGVSSEQISASQLIPANTFTVGDIIRINWRVAKTGTASTISVKLYVNTTNSLVGAIQVAQNLPGFTNSVSNGYIRMLAIKSATNTQSITPASVFDEYLTASQVGTSNINWAVDQYIIFMTQLNSATADVVRTSYYLIEKL